MSFQIHQSSANVKAVSSNGGNNISYFCSPSECTIANQNDYAQNIFKKLSFEDLIGNATFLQALFKSPTTILENDVITLNALGLYRIDINTNVSVDNIDENNFKFEFGVGEDNEAATPLQEDNLFIGSVACYYTRENVKFFTLSSHFIFNVTKPISICCYLRCSEDVVQTLVIGAGITLTKLA